MKYSTNSRLTKGVLVRFTLAEKRTFPYCKHTSSSNWRMIGDGDQKKFAEFGKAENFFQDSEFIEGILIEISTNLTLKYDVSKSTDHKSKSYKKTDSVKNMNSYHESDSHYNGYLVDLTEKQLRNFVSTVEIQTKTLLRLISNTDVEKSRKRYKRNKTIITHPKRRIHKKIEDLRKEDVFEENVADNKVLLKEM